MESFNGITHIPIKLDSCRSPVLFSRPTGAEHSWFALYVQVNHEKEVAKRLDQRAVGCFLPTVECWSKRRDRRKRIQIPLFPGYVFFNVCLDNHIHVQILKTPGVVSILKNSEGPLPIPAYQIETLKTIMNGVEPPTPHPYLGTGDWAKVVRGPFAGAMGILVRRDQKKGKLVLSLDIIMKSVSVELDVEDVEPVATPSGFGRQ